MSETHLKPFDARKVIEQYTEPLWKFIQEKRSVDHAKKAFRQVTEANRVLQTINADSDEDFSLNAYRPGTVFYVNYPFSFIHPPESRHHIQWYILGNEINEHPTIYRVKFTSLKGMHESETEGVLPHEPFELEKIDIKPEDEKFKVKNTHKSLLRQDTINQDYPNCQTSKLTIVGPSNPNLRRGRRSRIKLSSSSSPFNDRLVTMPVTIRN
ncbi:hypothetical protein HY029_01040 [Candidatus Gottesmanbacteria bacterium]|nr:hypothetical protein [Candidatus Gottesmanbacteria bacterium]